ncbi:MAG: tRNA 2-thiocytidine(32) synthetase TtcA [Lachnospiraceae bacterium]|nr:tRNA 2-thiocytidine(32) synthetase TtcA [Lachnospiraceae bacterium]MDE6698433.1 tRNA 2-thiocytidine(32) synthetase TtcA [Lachnospiraceae bacterium]
MELQRLYSYTRKAIDDYKMIDDGDRIAIGISGGKDSLTLLYALSGLRRFYPKKFELVAISVDLGLGIQNFDKIEQLCKSLYVPLHIVPTEIGKIVFDDRKETNPCSLCAKMRKGALNEKALELNCNKIAYAHHKDDIIETMMMSLIYEGRIHSFAPVTFLDRTGLTVLRPMMYVSEAEVIGFRNKMDLPVAKNPCPVDGHTKREYIKNLIKQINMETPGVKDRMFTAIKDKIFNTDKK